MSRCDSSSQTDRVRRVLQGRLYLGLLEAGRFRSPCGPATAGSPPGLGHRVLSPPTLLVARGIRPVSRALTQLGGATGTRPTARSDHPRRLSRRILLHHGELASVRWLSGSWPRRRGWAEDGTPRLPLLGPGKGDRRGPAARPLGVFEVIEEAGTPWATDSPPWQHPHAWARPVPASVGDGERGRVEGPLGTPPLSIGDTRGHLAPIVGIVCVWGDPGTPGNFSLSY